MMGRGSDNFNNLRYMKREIRSEEGFGNLENDLEDDRVKEGGNV